MSNWWNIKNSAGEDDTPAEMQLYGYIGEWDDISSAEVVKQLKVITAKTIVVRINSYGGSVFTAQAILSSLKRHPANVTVYIDGIAASAATIIAMAGDKIIIPANAMMMIHNPWTLAAGDSEELRSIAEMMDKVRNSILAAYREKTGLSDEKLIELMDAETWFSADEAVELGFADEVEQPMRLAASLNNGVFSLNGMSFDASRFAHLPDSLAKLTVPDNKQSAVPTAHNEEEIVDLETLKNKHPDLYNQVFNAGKDDGVKAERERIKQIEDSVIPGHDELVNKAKFETGVSAEALALEIMNAERGRNAAYLQNRMDDADPLKKAVDTLAPQNKGEQEVEAVKNSIGSAFQNRNKR
ncbi:Clp protease ClpP [Salmonella enterica]|nr:Clp protease ClpP [Salmonella enterica]EED5526412.1 Clp protease ClpP [Salmonella enterica subsp. enterica serovar Muenchen]EGO0887771.1 Clp protease ClpP [Salmonella enterica]EKC4536966.1 Clp protease ClpP [Salmonella enterica subsp. enterica]EKC4652903.1 Clp protease ClpP [Salmonella enterica]